MGTGSLSLTISNGRQQKELSKKSSREICCSFRQFGFKKEVNFVYPKNKEQAKIGNLFKGLDKSIDLHQKKIKDYQTLKKSALQQMFV
jgi:hypothetical protein